MGDDKKVLAVDNVVLCTGQEPNRDLYDSLVAAGVPVHLIGGADVAAELDAKRAIDQGTRLAATISPKLPAPTATSGLTSEGCVARGVTGPGGVERVSTFGPQLSQMISDWGPPSAPAGDSSDGDRPAIRLRDLDDVIDLGLGGQRAKSTKAARADAAQPLTRRELQVAALIESGLFNRDIAKRLVIAKRTADGHVERILAKLGFTSRAQVAAWMSQRSARAGTLV